MLLFVVYRHPMTRKSHKNAENAQETMDTVVRLLPKIRHKIKRNCYAIDKKKKRKCFQKRIYPNE